MTTWHTFTDAAPDLADRARSIIGSTTNCVLGTIRKDGAPRLSGIDPFFVDGELYIGSMDGARKAHDLRRDPRMALHGIPWESRRDPGDADAKLTGRAVPITDQADIDRVMASFKEERGFEPPEGGDLFRIEPETVVLVFVEDDQLVIDRWSQTDGRNTSRRS